MRPWPRFTILLCAFAMYGAANSSADALEPHYGAPQPISVTGNGDGRLVTFTLGPEGLLYGLIGTNEGYGPREGVSDKPDREVVVLNVKGEIQRRFPLPFEGERLVVAANGEIVVAGNGRIARFQRDGKELANAALPHVEIVLADKDELKAAAEEQHQENLEMYEQQVKQFEEVLAKKIKADKAKKADKSKKPAAPNAEPPAEPAQPADASKAETAAEESSLEELFGQISVKDLRAALKEYKKTLADLKKSTPESRLHDFITSFKSSASVHSVQLTTDGVYYVARGIRGYGYALWQVSLDLKNPQKVLDGLGGCCGQCDVHLHDGKIYVADNTKHRVSVYDANGKLTSHFGKSARGGADGFGGCCNPMNLCFGPGGEILTAESEGIVKQFSADGKFERVLAKNALKDGCKHVAVAITSDGQQLFFLDQPGSNIIRLTAEPADQPAKTTVSE